MSLDSSESASGHNKPYDDTEEQLLVTLKGMGLSWHQIAIEFNSRVATDRQRSASALENKWRQLRHAYALYPFLPSSELLKPGLQTL